MKNLSQRLVSLALVVSLTIGLVVVAPSASAAWSLTDLTWFDDVFVRTGAVSYDELENQRDRLDAYIKVNTLGFVTSPVTISYNSAVGAWMLYDSGADEYYRTSLGNFPYALPDAAHPVPGTGDTGDTTIVNNNKYYIISAPENTSGTSSNRWRSKADLISSGLLDGTLGYDVKFTYGDLSATAASLPPTNTQTFSLAPLSGGFYGVRKTVSSGAGDYDSWLCNKDGQPFVALKSSKESAANQNYNYYAPVDNSSNINTDVKLDLQVLDSNNKTFSYFEGNHYFQQNIDSLYFDASTKTYHADTYDITYNNDNRVYETNYYTWNITYNITNTYVTYIGSNDAYQQKEYEFYYELPDGRSSADLTADEVAAMSFQFADCINYQRSATDTNLRALYHFDGDLNDSGYFSDKTSFTWQQGASITYMDSSTFNGALYLDETAHRFNIALPSPFSSGKDFTVQFRYYQASQPDTLDNINNSISLGGSVLFKWDDQHLYTAANAKISRLPTGNWVELALVRSEGFLYLYLNGVKIWSAANSVGYYGTVSMAFGETSRAYSMLDELRVLDFALVKSGASYTPTSVPYDSNLVLVLPGADVVEDRYLDIGCAGINLLETDFTSPDFSFSTSALRYSSGQSSSDVLQWHYETVWGEGATSAGPAVAVSDYNGLYLSGVVNGRTASLGGYFAAGFYYPLIVQAGSSHFELSDFSLAGSYTLTVVTSDGEVVTLAFSASNSSTWQSVSQNGLYVGYRYSKSSSSSYSACIFLSSLADSDVTVVYACLEVGNTSSVDAHWVTDVYDADTLNPNTAAIQTDIPIHGYTVGGVRPTFPVKGDVWMMVEGRRVSRVQVYTGSAWTSTNARWWTGERWIPIYAFDIFTLEDCWDIADADDVITPITTDTAGWNWWKKAWTDFRSWLASAWSGGGGGGSGPGGGETVYPSAYPSPPASVPPLQDDDGNDVSIWDFPGKLFGSLWSVLSGMVNTVADGVGGLFTMVDNGTSGFFGSFVGDDGVFGFATYGGADIWD